MGALHLVGGASAEFEQFFPVFLEEVEQAGNRCVLFFLGIPKGIPADVDVQTAGIRLVRAVAHPNRAAQEFLPRHIPAVVIEAHRVRD